MSEFLDAIFPDNQDPLNQKFIEVRAIKEGTYPRQSFHRSKEEVEVLAPALVKDLDVYFGVLRRAVPKGDNSAIDDETHILWGDYDAKVLDKAKVFQQITLLSPAPQIVVDSGSGYHVYWLLNKAYPFTLARDIMDAIAKQTGGDHVSDKARILRLPGTLNHKFYPPRPVRLLRLDLLRPRYRLSDFVDYIDKGPEPQTEPSFEDIHGPSAPSIPFAGVPGWLTALIGYDPGHGKRSEHAYHVAAALVELGYDDADIESVFAENPDGVGAKYAEKGEHASRWLGYTLRSVRSRA